MKTISNSVPKRDHFVKITGKAQFVSDFPTDGMLFARILRSNVPHGRVLKVTLPTLPEGYAYFDKDSVPAKNEVHMVGNETPVFVEEFVHYIGDPIGMLVGPDERMVGQLLSQIEVEYEELEPIFDVMQSDVIFYDFGYEKGDIAKAFAEADKVYEEKLETGLQEHAYLETQGIIADYKDGIMHVHGSMQCPYYVHSSVTGCTGLPADKVHIEQDATGGGFGGKEDYPSVIANQAAVGSYHTGKPVRIVFERQEDILSTSKRHPCYCTYKVAVKDGEITAMDIDVIYDGGGYHTLSMVVLQRGLIGACGAYNIPNLKVHGQARKTNTVPNGAFRGFGGPQTFFSCEMVMTHIAKDLGVDSVDFKLKHLAKQGDPTSTSGMYHWPVSLPAMVDQVAKASDYYKKQAEYKNQTGRYRRGVGMSMIYHGAGFTGNGERDLIAGVAKLHKTADGKVEILVSASDIGQGIRTTLSKIAAEELGIPMEDIIYAYPNTARVPDSGPTVASRSTMNVGILVERAAKRLKAEWKDGEDQLIEEHYEHPDFLIPFTLDSPTGFNGDAYPCYPYAVNCVEVEIDTLTGYIKVIGAWGSYDVGTPMDINIVTGQMEGGFLQALGYGMMEKMTADKGWIRNNTLSDYIIPTAVDVDNMHVMFHVEEYAFGPQGAKGAGELPNVAGAPAVVEAIQNALDVPISKTPFLPEDVMNVLREVK